MIGGINLSSRGHLEFQADPVIHVGVTLLPTGVQQLLFVVETDELLRLDRVRGPTRSGITLSRWKLGAHRRGWTRWCWLERHSRI